MQHDWFMYHPRSNFKNRLDFPFKIKTGLEPNTDCYYYCHDYYYYNYNCKIVIIILLLLMIISIIVYHYYHHHQDHHHHYLQYFYHHHVSHTPGSMVSWTCCPWRRWCRAFCERSCWRLRRRRSSALGLLASQSKPAIISKWEDRKIQYQ